MTSRTTLSLLLVAALLGLSMADFMEDELYRRVRSPLGGEARGPKDEDRHKPRDSWKKIVQDMQSYMKVLSDNSDGIEQSLKDLCEKVDKNLELNGKENYNLWYAKKLLNEQRAAIQALKSGGPVSSSKARTYDELMRQTEEYVRSMGSGSGAAGNARSDDMPLENSKLYETLQTLKNL